jgi:hypothetical protein
VAARCPIFIVVLFVADALLSGAYLGNYLAGQPFYTPTLLLDVDGEANIPTWFSSMQLFSIAGLLALVAWSRKVPGEKGAAALVVLPVLFLVLSLDEVAQIHEWLGSRSDVLLPDGRRTVTVFRQTGIWMFVLGGPFVALLAWLLWSVKNHFAAAGSAFRKFVLGCGVFLLGALGAELVSNVPAPTSLGYVVTVFCEETLEMVGLTLVLWATYVLAAAHVVVDRRSAASASPPCAVEPAA